MTVMGRGPCGERKGRRHDAGFSLIELMVVVLILAVLMAIAIPVFLTTRQKANDRAAQTALRVGMTVEKIYYADSGRYTDDVTVPGEISNIELAIPFRLGPVPLAGEIGAAYVEVATTTTTDDTVCVTGKSKSGRFFGIRDVGPSGTRYYSGSVPPGPCAVTLYPDTGF